MEADRTISNLHRLDAVDFPRIAFRNQAVEKRANGAIGSTKIDLHQRRGSAHFHVTKFDPLRAGDIAVIAPDHRFVLGCGEFLLNTAGRLPISARIIRRAKSRELLFDDYKKLMRGRRWDLLTHAVRPHNR